MSHEEEYEKAKRIQELVVPRLRALEEKGNSSTIHKTRSLIALMGGGQTIYEEYRERSDIDKMAYWANRFYLASKEAEDWLVEYAKKLG